MNDEHQHRQYGKASPRETHPIDRHACSSHDPHKLVNRMKKGKQHGLLGNNHQRESFVVVAKEWDRSVFKYLRRREEWFESYNGISIKPTQVQLYIRFVYQYWHLLGVLATDTVASFSTPRTLSLAFGHHASSALKRIGTTLLAGQLYCVWSPHQGRLLL